MSDRQSDLLMQEVDEDLFRERLHGFWVAFRGYIIGGAVGVVSLVAGNEIYGNYLQSARGAASDVFVAAQEAAAEDASKSIAEWERAAEQLDGAYGNLAAMQAAAAAYEVGDVEAAIAQYEALGQKGAIDATLRDSARLNAAMIAADELGDLVRARSLLVLVAQQASPWQYSARELLALIDLKEGEKQAALEAFQSLSVEPATPSAIKARANQFVAALEVSVYAAGDQPDETPADTAAGTSADETTDPTESK